MIDIILLTQELIDAGLPITGVAVLPLGSDTSGYGCSTFYVREGIIVRVDWIPADFPPTPIQDSLAASIVAAHNGPRELRPPLDIWNDLALLTDVQRDAIWTDLTSGSPQKFLVDNGPHAFDVWQQYRRIQDEGLGVNVQKKVKAGGVVAYLLDFPKYLVHPSFDPTINVPGDRPKA